MPRLNGHGQAKQLRDPPDPIKLEAHIFVTSLSDRDNKKGSQRIYWQIVCPPIEDRTAGFDTGGLKPCAVCPFPFNERKRCEKLGPAHGYVRATSFR